MLKLTSIIELSSTNLVENRKELPVQLKNQARGFERNWIVHNKNRDGQ
jgi:hypothetical protein